MRQTQQFVLALVVLGATIIFSPQLATAQDKPGTWGIGFSVSEASPALMLRIWSSPTFTLEPEVGLMRVSRENRDPVYNILIGLGFIAHGREGSNFRPLGGVRVSMDMVAGSSTRTFRDVYFGPVFGGEYFFTDNFSVAGEFQLSIVATDDFSSPSGLPSNSTIIATGQLLSVQYRF